MIKFTQNGYLDWAVEIGADDSNYKPLYMALGGDKITIGGSTDVKTQSGAGMDSWRS